MSDTKTSKPTAFYWIGTPHTAGDLECEACDWYECPKPCPYCHEGVMHGQFIDAHRDGYYAQTECDVCGASEDD